MPTKIEKDDVTGQQTTGHEWDGVKELNTPMPTWWVYTFYATIVWAVGYAVIYPSIPWFTGHTKGTSGYVAREDVTRQIAAARGALKRRLQVDDDGLMSIVRLVSSHLDLTLSGFFRDRA